MDNFYFSLDKNAKKFTQYLTIDWTEAKEADRETTISIVEETIKRYPIIIPLFCSTRVPSGQTSCRFIEFMVNNISESSYPIVRDVVECRCIRYKNGRDYVREEILPLILKETIKKINEGSHKIEHYELLALTLKHSWVAEIKIDLIQNSIDALKY